ncbi:MAG TPA: DNA-binding protein [Rhodocyclaceae bacterium]|nr:DNA-binding protein [Rhodocyclaceae bacterium]
MATRTADEARAELQRQGVSISSWAIANGFSTNLVFEVLAGRKKCIRGQAHNIAVKLGLKEGAICSDPAKALDLRAA